jgi:hypothetical protein
MEGGGMTMVTVHIIVYVVAVGLVVLFGRAGDRKKPDSKALDEANRVIRGR